MKVSLASTFVKTQVLISEEEFQNFPPGASALSLVVHETPGGGQHHLSKLSGGQQVVCPLLNVVQGNVEPVIKKNLKIW